LVEHCSLFFATCSFYLHTVYSVLHIFVLLPHVANKLNHIIHVFKMFCHYDDAALGQAQDVMLLAVLVQQTKRLI